jgi:hypothetical protein
MEQDHVEGQSQRGAPLTRRLVELRVQIRDFLPSDISHGYVFGRSRGHRPLLLGCAMVLVGGVLTGVAIDLGG